MNWSLSILSLLFISEISVAQESRPSPFIFSKYVQGTVLQKGGGTVQALLNYNTFTQEMMFEDKGSRLVLDQSANIDTIYLQNRKFIPTKGVFFEKLTSTPVALYVQHSNKAVYESGKRVEANGVLSDNYKKKEDKTVDPYALVLPENFRLQSESKYWLQKGDKFVQITSLKKIADLFPGKENLIENYVKDNNTRLTNQNDLVNLIMFCNQ